MISEDGHSIGETPVPFPNTEAKPDTSKALVSERRRSVDAVFFFFIITKFLIWIFFIYFRIGIDISRLLLGKKSNICPLLLETRIEGSTTRCGRQMRVCRSGQTGWTQDPLA